MADTGTRFVVYKNFQQAIQDRIPELTASDAKCFPNEDDEHQLETYATQMMKYLAPEWKPTDSPDLSGTNTIEVYGVYFEKSRVRRLPRHTYEFCMLLSNDSKSTLLGSCLLENESGNYEIHDVCVAVPGKGYCKILIQRAAEHVMSLPKAVSLTIYCENNNGGACGCYNHVFLGLQHKYKYKKEEGAYKTRWTITKVRGSRSRSVIKTISKKTKTHAFKNMTTPLRP